MNQFPRLVQIGRLVLGQAALNGGGTHEVDGCGVDDFDGWDLSYVAGCTIQIDSSSLGLSLLE
jgi:hypothetical protein